MKELNTKQRKSREEKDAEVINNGMVREVGRKRRNEGFVKPGNRPEKWELGK